MRYILVPLLLLTACAHHKFDDVRPGEGGVNTVIVKNEDPTEASREALRQVRAYCDDLKKTPAVTDEKSQYFGDVSEDTYKKMRRAGKAAEEISGGIVKNTDKATADYAGAGYEETMQFKCE